MIVKEGSMWVLKSKNGKKTLGKFKTKKEAQKREKQIQFFKNRK